MKVYGVVDVQIHVFLTSALTGGEWSASCTSRITSGKEPQYPLDKSMSGPQNWSRRRGENS
jgi:hypothetical protein